MGVVDVVLAADRKFLWGCAVAGRSLLDHASDPTAVRLTVVHGGLRPDEVAALRASWLGEGVPEARFILFPQERVAHLVRSKSVSHLSYARLLIGDFLPADARRAVYIDTDVVFGCDVLELADLPLNSAHAGAVPNGDEDDTRIQFLRLGITADRYYNAGILLLDIEVWRSFGHTNRSLEIAASYGARLLLHDQDALNVLLAGRWRRLPEKWNSVARRTKDSSGVVLHYTMSPKPWDADYRGPHRQVFFDVLDRTAFAGRRPPHWFGVAPVLSKLRRSVPYWPTVKRRIGAALGFRSD